MSQFVDHQRKGHQCEKLVEDVQREHVGAERQAQGYAVGHNIKHEERIFAMFVLHIFKGVKGGQRPQDGHHACE